MWPSVSNLLHLGGYDVDQLSTSIPDSVILSPDLPLLAKLVYMVLLQQAKNNDYRCKITHLRLGELCRLSRSSVTAQVKVLTDAGLIRSLGHSDYYVVDHSAAAWRTMLDQVTKRLLEAKYLGEALMREWLTLLILSSRWTDGARPGYLVNPMTGERMEWDRLCELDKPTAEGFVSVAFEYNGPQHYGPTARYPSDEDARKRRARDLIKLGLGVENNVKVIIIHRQDLTMQGMLKKIGNLLPLREGVEGSPVAQYLEAESKTYRNNMARRSQRRQENQDK